MCPRLNGPSGSDGPENQQPSPDASRPVPTPIKPLLHQAGVPGARIVPDEYLADFLNETSVNCPAFATFTPELHILPANQLALWPSLRPIRAHGFVLYGGTAVSLRLVHRVSVDFDFFSERPFDHSALISALPFYERAQVIQEAPNTLTLLVTPKDGVGEGVKVSFFGGLAIGRVGHPQLTDDGVLLAASLLDLMGSKLKVIQQRAEKKDYFDIHKMLECGVRLDDGLAAGRALYGKTFQPSEALKAMVYFNDGDLPEIPAHIREALITAASSVRTLPVLSVVSSRLGVGEAR